MPLIYAKGLAFIYVYESRKLPLYIPHEPAEKDPTRYAWNGNGVKLFKLNFDFSPCFTPRQRKYLISFIFFHRNTSIRLFFWVRSEKTSLYNIIALNHDDSFVSACKTAMNYSIEIYTSTQTKTIYKSFKPQHFSPLPLANSFIRVYYI